MTSCHGGPPDSGSGPSPTLAAASSVALAERTPRVALLGTPNAGKSSLANQLTGSRQWVTNAPGTTVHVAAGRGRVPGEDGQAREVEVVDLPGTYSLVPMSPDEQVVRDVLVGQDHPTRPDLVVLVADALHLTRSLYLLAQLGGEPPPVVVAVTMADLAAARGVQLDVDVLRRRLGVPVVVVNPRSGAGLDGLRDVLAQGLEDVAAGTALRPVLPEGQGDGVADEATGPDDLALAEARFAWVEDVVTAVVTDPAAGTEPVTWSDRLDRVLLSPVLGVPVFLVVMWAVFAATTQFSVPLQQGLAGLVVGPLTAVADQLLAAVGLGDTWVRGLVVDGLIAGVGTVVSFLPLMATMFVLLGVLEDSGYLARGALVVDRLLRAVGLDGRAFLPLLVGFGCNVPAFSATRILPDARQRVLTSMLVPFVTCSARLTVYVMVASIFFGQRAGTVVFGMYLLSLTLVVLLGLALRRTAFRGMQRQPLVLDLPPYRLPHLATVARQAWVRTLGFLRGAFGIIVAVVVAVWLLMAVPLPGAGDLPGGAGQGFGQVTPEQSLLGGASRAAAPLLAPAGLDDWHVTAALASGFVAKEVVVSTLAQTYAAADPTDVRQPGELGERFRASLERSSGGHGVAAALAFMVFVLAYTPCAATLAEQRRHVGGRWTLAGVGIGLSTAWVLAVLVFQVAKAVGG